MSLTITAPSDKYLDITVSDVTDLPEGKCRGIYVGVAGDIAAVTINGSTVQFKNASQGSVIPIVAIRVNSTGTSATDLVALYSPLNRRASWTETESESVSHCRQF